MVQHVARRQGEERGVEHLCLLLGYARLNQNGKLGKAGGGQEKRGSVSAAADAL